ncbi:PASTA domain-containing protein [Kitasatospora sp. P5_F3]
MTTLLALAACNPTVAGPAGVSSAPATGPATATTGPEASASATKSASAGSAGSATLPTFTGMGLQTAQDRAQAAGFYALRSHDALGRSRTQIDDRNWKVCFQAPAAGQRATGAVVDFGTVKLDEQCPAQDQGTATAKAGATMPDFRGKSVAAVKDALDKSTSYAVKDALQGRMVIVESNWQVCTQDPAAGAALNGQPVSLRVVKFGESCP